MTKLKLIDDIFDRTRVYEIDRPKDSILTDLLFYQRKIRKLQERIKICLHVAREQITVHLWTDTEDVDFTKCIVALGEIPLKILSYLEGKEVTYDAFTEHHA